MTKAETLNALTRGEGCLGKSQDDEPVFVLTARDPAAPEAVRKWAEHAWQAGHSAKKIDEALSIATEMERWRDRRVSV
jgi:hypothetical protein